MKKHIARISICMALAYILGFFDIFKLPFGGGISLESIPLMLLAWMCGPVAGFVGGFVYGLLMLTKPSAFVHPIQFLLDYPLAFSSFFILGFLGKNISVCRIYLFSIASFLLRGCFHCISGVLFAGLFLKHVPENILLYSVAYNASYILPTAAVCCIFFHFIATGLAKRKVLE